MVHLPIPTPSALGVSSGRVYEELWNRAQLEPLNQTNTTPGYEVSLAIMILVALAQLVAGEPQADVGGREEDSRCRKESTLRGSYQHSLFGLKDSRLAVRFQRRCVMIEHSRQVSVATQFGNTAATPSGFGRNV